MSPISNQWIKIDQESLKKQFGEEGFAKQLEDIQKQKDLSPQQIQKVQDSFINSNVIKITNKLKNEKVNDINTYHYNYIINQEGLKKFLMETSDIIGDPSLKDEALYKDMDKTKITGEIWVGTRDLLPYKMKFHSEMEATKEKQEGQFTVTIEFKNYHKPVKVEAPTTFKTLEEVFSELFSGFTIPEGTSEDEKVPASNK